MLDDMEPAHSSPQICCVFFLRFAHDVLPLVLCVCLSCALLTQSLRWLAINDFLTVGHRDVDVIFSHPDTHDV